MPAETVYAIWYKNESGLWVQYQTFKEPLEADRAFQALEKLNPRLEVRLIRQVVTILAETGGE